MKWLLIVVLVLTGIFFTIFLTLPFVLGEFTPLILIILIMGSISLVIERLLHRSN